MHILLFAAMLVSLILATYFINKKPVMSRVLMIVTMGLIVAVFVLWELGMIRP